MSSAARVIRVISAISIGLFFCALLGWPYVEGIATLIIIVMLVAVECIELHRIKQQALDNRNKTVSEIADHRRSLYLLRICTCLLAFVFLIVKFTESVENYAYMASVRDSDSKNSDAKLHGYIERKGVVDDLSYAYHESHTFATFTLTNKRSKAVQYRDTPVSTWNGWTNRYSGVLQPGESRSFTTRIDSVWEFDRFKRRMAVPMRVVQDNASITFFDTRPPGILSNLRLEERLFIATIVLSLSIVALSIYSRHLRSLQNGSTPNVWYRLDLAQCGLIAFFVLCAVASFSNVSETADTEANRTRNAEIHRTGVQGDAAAKRREEINNHEAQVYFHLTSLPDTLRVWAGDLDMRADRQRSLWLLGHTYGERFRILQASEDVFRNDMKKSACEFLGKSSISKDNRAVDFEIYRCTGDLSTYSLHMLKYIAVMYRGVHGPTIVSVETRYIDYRSGRLTNIYGDTGINLLFELIKQSSHR